MLGLCHGLTTCNQTNVRLLLGESETAPCWVVTQRKLLFAEYKEIRRSGFQSYDSPGHGECVPFVYS